ncbi:noncompact myelin-associated protein [Oryzias latipes]|uniref:noncompact myelin-associated protein n=1 Tax=Oryzias latipes TaxID=8090 RepID=UPI0005CB8CC6|nr:noncompact myelin-associated protein [Oryzias latipes]
MSSVSTTITSTTTAITKSQEQVLIQSSGAMIAVIVIGFIIILAIILIIMKTYNRRTHTSRILGVRSGTKPRPKLSQSTAQSTMPLSPLGVSSISGSITNSNPGSESSFRLPRVELPSMEENRMEQFSTTSDSTVVTIHEPTSPANT